MTGIVIDFKTLIEGFFRIKMADNLFDVVISVLNSEQMILTGVGHDRQPGSNLQFIELMSSVNKSKVIPLSIL